MQHQLKEASVKIEAEKIVGLKGATKVEQQGYQCG